MLPDFKKTKSLIEEQQTKFLNERIAFHMGGLGSIGTRPIHEGSGFITEYEDGQVDDSNLQKIHSKVTYTPEEVIKNPNIVFENLDMIARDHAAQQSKMIIDKVSYLTEKIGNTSDFRGKLTAETILDSLNKITIDFNSDGTPILPSIVAGHEAYDSFKKAFEEIENTPELKLRMEKIMTDQKQRWYDRAANRKLVD
jgi:hypothetical protein